VDASAYLPLFGGIRGREARRPRKRGGAGPSRCVSEFYFREGMMLSRRRSIVREASLRALEDERVG